MDIISSLRDKQQWQQFLIQRKAAGHLSDREESALEDYIRNERYLPVVAGILNRQPFPPPRRAAISKMHSDKKRIVYIYPEPERNVLKFLTFLLQRKYDTLFAPNLYSFRPGTGVRSAVEYLTDSADIAGMWSYKVDIQDYFNSIPLEIFLPVLEQTLSDEPEVFAFLSALLLDPRVETDGSVMQDYAKGIMAGTPVSTFLANLYLSDLDWEFARQGRLYARYSDDIITFAPTEEILEENIRLIHQALSDRGLSINPRKEHRTAPGEPWDFLGFRFAGSSIDIAPASVEKLKAKMRRKTRALARWKDRKGASGESAAKAFIRVFNHKLFENPIDHELTWTRWYFPMISTTASLKTIDAYAQRCIRYLATGKNTKSAYNFRYEDMKALGYISLTAAYYRHDAPPKNQDSCE